MEGLAGGNISRLRGGIAWPRRQPGRILAKCVSSQRSWAAAYNPCHLERDGVPIFAPDEGAHRLCQHCSDIFCARDTDIPNECVDDMLAFAQSSLPDVRWNIEVDEFEEILASKRGSAPDQMAYLIACTALLAALEPNIYIYIYIFATYQACLQGAALPVGFGASRTVFIHKSTDRGVLSV